MHRSRLSTFVIDCKVDDIDAATAFWAAALGRDIEPLDPSEPDYREIAADAGEPRLLLQRVGHDSRVHLDIEADDLDAEVARLEALGATRIEFVKRWWLMRAPSGHVFCVVKPQRGALEGKANVNEWP